MAEPETVATCIRAMRAASGLPITVKTRLGIDDQDSWEFLYRFIATVADAGCPHVILHARKAWLSGLSPRENREVPPLQYETVYRIKQAFPQLTITLNGGVRTVAETAAHLVACDGVMIGRAISENPWFLAELADALFDERPFATRAAAVGNCCHPTRRPAPRRLPLTGPLWCANWQRACPCAHCCGL